MKQILLALLLSTSIKCYSQNLIGESYIDIKNEMIQTGAIVREGVTDNGYRFIMAQERLKSKCYYFDASNVCFEYILITPGITYAQWMSVLDNTGYMKYDDDFFYKSPYRAKLVFDKDLSEYVLIITYQIKN